MTGGIGPLAIARGLVLAVLAPAVLGGCDSRLPAADAHGGSSSSAAEGFRTCQGEGFSLDGLVAFVEATRPETVETFLTLLPECLRANFTLVYDSRSAHLASDTYPRIVLFGPDARVLVAIPGDPSDLAFDRVEIIGLTNDELEWETAELVFSEMVAGQGPNVRRGPESCHSCHGERIRPIWHDYPTWPGVFGSFDNHLDEAEADALRRVQEAGFARYDALPIQDRDTLIPGAPFLIPHRNFASTNIAFTFDLAAVVARNLAHRARAHHDSSLVERVVAREFCDQEVPIEEYRALGLVSSADFELGLVGADAATNDYRWSLGPSTLSEYVAFVLLVDLARNDQVLASAMGSTFSSAMESYEQWFVLRGVERWTWLGEDFDAERDLLSPRSVIKPRLMQVCETIAARRE